MTEEKFKLATPGTLRVRIAPSPTGFLHIGTARTALFNYLLAKKNQGSFILRIEDTDRERSTAEFERDIIENLKWLGIDWSEGPDKDGEYGPYRQSGRLDIYKDYLKKLLAENKAYYCFCTEEELETQRQYQMSQGLAPCYTGKCANLSPESTDKYLGEGKPSVIRFRVIAKKLKFNDLIRGDLEFDTGLIGDIVIAKDLNAPLYNLAVAVDDFEMRISLVLRGEDHLSNTPKQILLQEALGFNRPQYAHLPLILGPDRTKLSKRHGATGVSEFKKAGYLPESLVNFISFLGWNPGDEREIYSLSSLAKEFSLEKVQKGGAIFNVKRLDFLNGFYIRQKSLEKLAELCLPYLVEAGLITPSFSATERMPNFTGYFGKEIVQEYTITETKEKIDFKLLTNIIGLYRERMKKLSEILELADFFFKDELEYNKDLLKWKNFADEEIKSSLENTEKTLLKINDADWKKEKLENTMMPEAEKTGDRGKVLWPLRAALTGKKASAGPFEVAEILGKKKTLRRIKKAIKLLQ